MVWERLGNVGNYVEPFAGSLAVLLARPHEARIETVNDRDCYLANFWRAVQSAPDRVADFADWPVNECDLQARHRWLCERPDFRERMLADPDYFDAKIAGWWVWGISQWIGAGWCSRPEWVGSGQGGRAPRGINTDRYVQRPMLSTSGDGVHSFAAWAGHLDGKAKRPVLNRGSRGVVNMDRRVRPNESPDWQHRPHITDAGNGVHCKRPHLGGYASMGVQSERPLHAWMFALAERLRRVRVCCGDWSRILTPSCTWKLGGGQLTGVLLDPPYSHELRDNRLYSIEQDIAGDVRKWAIEAGRNANMRIALCGLENEHDMPADWQVEYWRAPRGYSKRRRREVIWFSPHCLKPQGRLDLFAAEAAHIAIGDSSNSRSGH